MNPFTALKNLSPFHLFIYLFIFILFLPPLILSTLHFILLCYSPLQLASLPFTFYFLSPSLPPLFYTFLTLVLKIWALPWEVPITPSGSWFVSVMDLFTKEYFPMSFVFWLWFSNDDRPYLSSLAPVTYPLSPSTPSHRYTLCTAQTCVLFSF